MVYLDEVLIFLCKIEVHINHIDEVLTLLDNASLSTKICKCQFSHKNFDYCGHVLLPGLIKIANDATSAITGKTLPEEITHLHSFLSARFRR